MQLEPHCDLGLAAWRASLLLFNCYWSPSPEYSPLSFIAGYVLAIVQGSLVTLLLILPPHCQILALQSPFSKFKVNLLVTVDGKTLPFPLWSRVMVINYGLLFQSTALVISYSH